MTLTTCDETLCRKIEPNVSTTAERLKALKEFRATEQVPDEFYTIVDMGGKILDVVVEHELYGQIAVDLIIASRQDADEFYERMSENRVKPLKE